jgi:hypothetical protein
LLTIGKRNSLCYHPSIPGGLEEWVFADELRLMYPQMRLLTRTIVQNASRFTHSLDAASYALGWATEEIGARQSALDPP